MKQMRKRQATTGSTAGGDDENPFDIFLSSTQIHYTFYSDTPKILGRTFGMCVLQDFEALTPNLLARTIETVEGGGLIVLLLHTMRSLKQLYTLTMDVHARYRTESHRQTEPRFNERFILSLSSCKQCLIVDDQLNVLPCSSEDSLKIEAIPAKTEENSLTSEQIELKELCFSLKDTQPIGHLIECCKTLDQGKVLLKLLDSITDKAFRHTCSITASRGRGKSAALGLAIAGAIAFGYEEISFYHTMSFFFFLILVIRIFMSLHQHQKILKFYLNLS
jgi:N-acetyltransferase 10